MMKVDNLATENWKKLTLFSQVVNSRAKAHTLAANPTMNPGSHSTILSLWSVRKCTPHITDDMMTAFLENNLTTSIYIYVHIYKICM